MPSPETFPSPEVGAFDQIYFGRTRLVRHPIEKTWNEQRDQLINRGGALQTNHIEVKQTNIKEVGQGLFAKVEIKHGEIVFCSHGDQYRINEKADSCFNPDTGEECACFPNQSAPNAICVFSKGNDEQMWMDQWLNPDWDNPLRYLNHSCEPNTVRTEDGYQFQTTRPIREGQQITVDYSTLEVNPKWKMECHCGSPNCRGTIGSVQTLPVEVIVRYWFDLPRFMKRRYLTALDEKKLDDSQKKIAKLLWMEHGSSKTFWKIVTEELEKKKKRSKKEKDILPQSGFPIRAGMTRDDKSVSPTL